MDDLDLSRDVDLNAYRAAVDRTNRATDSDIRRAECLRKIRLRTDIYAALALHSIEQMAEARALAREDGGR